MTKVKNENQTSKNTAVLIVPLVYAAMVRNYLKKETDIWIEESTMHDDDIYLKIRFEHAASLFYLGVDVGLHLLKELEIKSNLPA